MIVASQEPDGERVGVIGLLLMCRAVADEGTPMISMLVVLLKSAAMESVVPEREAVRTR